MNKKTQVKPLEQWKFAGNEARILLTSKCNYKCVFCHGEGVDIDNQKTEKPDKDGLLKIVGTIIEKGCTDITLTGGEPLIKQNLALDIIQFTARKNPSAKITITTNASLLAPEWLKNAAKYHNLRMNISLHTCDPEKFQTLTGQSRFTLENIRKKLSILRNYNVPFKINCVAMRNDTISKGEISEFASFAYENGAISLKIIELLVMEKHYGHKTRLDLLNYFEIIFNI